MGIDKLIAEEENRHYQKLKELKDILDMYNNTSRENAAYVARNVQTAAEYGINPDMLISYEDSRQATNPYDRQIAETNAEIAKENALYESNMATLRKRKEELKQQEVANNLAREKEREQKEIELLAYEQKINLADNERLELEKIVKTIYKNSIGSYYVQGIAKKYPEEYRQFQSGKDALKNHPKMGLPLNLEDRLKKINEEIEFYKSILPIFESFNQKLEEAKRESEQQENEEKNKKAIYNLIHREENERLREMNSLYNAWDLGDKVIPPEYQGLTYEQVEALLKQKEMEKSLGETSDETISDSSQDRKALLVEEIIKRMSPAELQYTPLPDIKRNLMAMNISELETMLGIPLDQISERNEIGGRNK